MIEANEMSAGSLTSVEVTRYSRQLILPEIGMQGQTALKQSSVLVVGAGGLGCPAALYLAAAGVGRLGIVDHDSVELSNLHRQILHRTSRLGADKASSAAQTLTDVNDSITVEAHCRLMSAGGGGDDGGAILRLVAEHQLVLDCTDNVATRYLLNDACVLTQRPLVSAAALRFDGQLCTYNYDGGPCYRCLFPQPPPPEAVTNCSDGGVLGVIPGIIGSLQAMEALRVLLPELSPAHSGSMLIYSGLDGQFRSVRLRQRCRHCAVCGDNPTIKTLIDYAQFCGAAASDKESVVSLLDERERLWPRQYCHLPADQCKLLVDVRRPHELHICRVPGAVNVPLQRIMTDGGVTDVVEAARAAVSGNTSVSHPVTVAMLCRRGNDSQKAAVFLKTRLTSQSWIRVVDIRGGLYEWKAQLDPDMLLY